MNVGKKHKILAWILSICLVITLIPEIGFAASANPTNQDTSNAPVVSPDKVTEENVIEKTEDTTTYNLGKGEKMTVFHGGEVRYKDSHGKLVDYAPSLVEIKDGEKSGQSKTLEGYAYKNKEGDKKHYLPETLSMDTPILMENGDYQIEFAPTDKTLEHSGAADKSVEVEKETIPTTYEQKEKLSIDAVYGTKDKGAVFTYTSGESIGRFNDK